jgi:hypothetical protein
MAEDIDALRARVAELTATARAGFTAARASARLEESSRHGAVPRQRLVRHEALRLANREGIGCDELRLLVYLSGQGEDVVSKTERATADLMAAFARADGLGPGSLEPIDLVEAWSLSEAWDVRSPAAAAAREADLDRSADSLCRLLHAFASDPDPVEGADLVARIVRDRLFPRPDRMACLIGPAIMRLALGSPHARFGLSAHLPPPDVFARMEPAEAIPTVLLAASAGASEAYADLEATRALRTDLCYRIAGERAGSRTPEAIDALLGSPVLGMGGLVAAVGLTHRGANLMIKRLAAAGVLRPHRANRSKGRLFVCDRSLRKAS